MGLGGCYGLIKYLIVLINLLFWLAGLFVIAVVVWMLTDPTFYVHLTQPGNDYYIGLYIILAAGILLVFVSHFGCCGAYKESRFMLISFFSCMLVIIVAELAAGAWCYYNGDRLESIVRKTARTTVQGEYGIVESRTAAFDTIQRELECCGSDGYSDWANSKYNKNGKNGLELVVSSVVPIVYKIPESCCKRDISHAQCETAREIGIGARWSGSIYGEGCTEKVVRLIRTYSFIAKAIGFSLVSAQLFAMLSALVLCYAVGRPNRYKA